MTEADWQFYRGKCPMHCQGSDMHDSGRVCSGRISIAGDFGEEIIYWDCSYEACPFMYWYEIMHRGVIEENKCK